MAEPGSELVVVPHTHWDREWYEPFQRFRIRLVAVLDDLLRQLDADPRLRFTLDGQTAAVDDYLEIRPTQTALVKELVERGQLAVGPWRVLADSFLCSGENLVRNLELGLRRAEELGGAMRVGYLPDQFGHCAQLPQLLRLAGISHACVWRGVPDAVRTTSFCWIAPDGTAIRTRYLPEGGYGGAAGIFGVADPAAVARRSREHIRALRNWQAEGSLLGMYGTDHSAPTPGLAELLAAVSPLVTDGPTDLPTGLAAPTDDDSPAPTVLRLETLQGFFATEPEDIAGLVEIHGELRSHARANILPGVISARIPLKAALSRAERLVERYAEPLTALYGLPFAAQPFLDLAWRRLVDSACHDSVTGCGVDATAAQVAARIAEAEDLGRGVCELVLSPIAATIPEGGHLVFNPSPRLRREVVTLDLPADRTLRDAQGRPVPLQFLNSSQPVFSDAVVAHADLDRFLRRVHGRELYGQQIVAWNADPASATLTFHLARTSDLPFDVAEVRAALGSVPEWRIRVLTQSRQRVAALVECGPLGLTAVTSGSTGPTTTSSAPQPDIVRGRASLAATDLDNGLVHVAMRGDGLLDLLACDGTHVSDVGAVTDGGDLGDEYNYAPPATDDLITNADEVWNRVLWSGPLTGSLESVRWYAWPDRGDFHHDSRSDETSLTEVTTRVELRHGEPFVRLTVAFDNHTDDHRVRLHLPLPRAAAHSYAEGQFAVTQRGLTAEGGHGERPIPTFPAYGWVAAGGLAVLLDHVSEYELIDDGRTLALTLLRSVGMLSRDRNAYREEPAGPQRETPGAQCHGPRTVEIALYLYAGEWHESGLLEAAERFRHPLTTTAGWNPDPDHAPTVPDGGIEVSGDGVVLTSCRDVSGATEARVIALGPRGTVATVRFGSGSREVTLRPWEIGVVGVDRD